ncbi:polysaccharide lyase [Amycolatopsis benzoatilytica]|uniref:polysaccharide lyase n=1 Tax=Amycolatopsis benzoatilytica TaxID=346045 RepID=UPI00035EE695|nr:hypothetical protein [Amycolatopsis benzoatilytica]
MRSLRWGFVALAAAAAVTAGCWATPAKASTNPAQAGGWAGTFDGFPSNSWRGAWGIDGSGEFGFGSTLSASGGVLDVKYGKGSSAQSCTDCPTKGGGQFYQDLAKANHSELRDATTLYLRYDLKFPAGFDFGKGGKLPGLYGGNPGEESGGNHGKGWSTRFMFRGGTKGEVYVYTPSGDGYGKDVGLGSWNFTPDGKTHTIEQSVNRSTGQITVWYDGKQVLSSRSAPGISGIPFKGVFFSTFFGGHETSWGPGHDEHAYFSNFAVSTAKL